MPREARLPALLLALVTALLAPSCRDAAKDSGRLPGAPLEHPSIVRQGECIDPSRPVFEQEWFRFYPAFAGGGRELWTFEGRLDFRTEVDRRALGIRAEPIGVAPGHFGPEWIFVRPDAQGSFRIRSLPPMQTLRLSLTGVPASLGGDYVDVTPEPGRTVGLPVYARSSLRLKLTRGDHSSLGRWIVGLRRPGDIVHALRGPNSHPNEGRGMHRNSRAGSEEVRFDGLHPGEYEMVALSVGFGRLRTRVTLRPGEDLDLGEVRIPRGFDLPVVVRAEAGSPLPAGLRVTATLLQSRARFTPSWPSRRLLLEQEVEEQAVTAPVDEASGKALLRGLYGGVYALRLIPGASNALQTPPLHVEVPACTSATLQLGGVAVVKGTVLDEGGVPFGNAVVTARLPQSPDFALQLSSSDEEGGFAFMVPEGLHEITARSRGSSYPRGEILLRTRSGEQVDLTIPFRPTAMFEGTVDLGRTRRHEPVLSLHPRIGQWDKIGIPIDADGSFHEAVPVGEYDLFDGTDFLRRVDLTDGGVRSRFAPDPATANVSVEVLDDEGRRIRHAWAAAIAADASLQSQLRVPPRFADRGSDGILGLPSLPVGRYTLVAGAPGFRQEARPLALVARGEVRERVPLARGGGCVALTVLRESDGNPVEEATIQQVTVDGRFALLGGRRTGSRGRIEIRGVPHGLLEFDIAPPTEFPPLAMARVRMEDLSPAALREQTAILAPGTLVRVVLYEGRLSPVTGAMLEVESLRHDAAGEMFAAYVRNFAPVSGYDGSFPTFAMPRGRPFLLRVRRTGHPVLETVITPAGSDLMLVEMRYPEPPH